MATRLVEASLNISGNYNVYLPPYNELLTAIQEVYPGKVLNGLTDAEVNTFFFVDRGTAEEIVDAQAILNAWHIVIDTMAAQVLLLPVNNA